MYKNKFITFTVITSLIFILLTSCKPLNIRQLLKKGQIPLNKNEIVNLVTDNRLHLVSNNFNSTVLFKKNGKISATTPQYGNNDTGKWLVNDKDQLCIKFNKWYYGDKNCYSIVKSNENEFSFFTTNGAFHYTATTNKKILSTTSKPLTKQNTSLTTTQDTSIRSGSTIRSIAQNCPNCDLTNANLANKELIKANLENTNLKGANLYQANLRRANLKGANLGNTNLIQANLAGANLTNAVLVGADLTGANLIHADFTNADIRGAIFKDNHLDKVKGLK